MTIIETTPRNAAGVYEARLELTINPQTGSKLIKSRSTMFPDDWDWARIKEEVEHAVRYNMGFYDSTKPWEGYYGLSKDGKIKIRFYYDDQTGYIASYFPQL